MYYLDKAIHQYKSINFYNPSLYINLYKLFFKVSNAKVAIKIIAIRDK